MSRNYVYLDRIPFPYYSSKNGDTSGLIAYFALIVSLAELGVGEREGAVHLLEREIQYQRSNISKNSSNYPLECSQLSKKECENVDKARRLILLLRLENVQEALMNGVQSSALDFARVRRGIEMISDYDNAMFLFDPDQRSRCCC